jgi:hypothetical protein
VELELHSGFLRSRQLWEFRQLKNLGRVLLPSRFRMVVLDWDALNRNLLGRLGDKSRRVLALARTKSTSIYALCHYLRLRGVRNVHRFLKPLQETAHLQNAINIWASDFEEAINGN